MDIEEMWRNMEPGKKEELLPDIAGKLEQLKSNNSLEKIKDNLLVNMGWGILICFFYAYILLMYDSGIIRLFIGIVSAFSLWAVATSWMLHKSLKSRKIESHNLLEELEYQYASIGKWSRNQQIVGLLIYPFSITGGFLWGGVMGSGKSVAVFMSKPLLWWVLLAALIALTPTCYWITKQLFKISFGKHMEKLRQNIEELKAVN